MCGEKALSYLGGGHIDAQAGIAGTKNSLHCKTRTSPNFVKSTHLCCDIVKGFGYTLVVDGAEVSINKSQDRKEVTMPAIAEILSTVATRPDPRGCDLPTCPVCADTMVAAEASAYLNDNVISYLWTCDTCGYGFVTKHSVKRFACN